MIRPTALVWLCLTATLPAAEPVTALAFDAAGRLAIGVGRQVVILDGNGDPDARLTMNSPVTALAAGRRTVVASGLPGRPTLVRILPTTDRPMVDFAVHKDAVYGLTISPDGRTVATASYDRLVKLLDADTGRERRELRDHSDSVYAVAFSPDGQFLASAAADRAVKIWNVAAGQRLYTLGDPTDWVYTVAYSPDGQHLAAAGVDKSIRVWAVNATGGTLKRAFFAHDAAVLKLAYSPDGKVLYSLSEDRTLKAWDSATGRERYHTDPVPASVHALALSPDGKRIAIGRHDGVVELRDAATGAALGVAYPVEPKPPELIAVTPPSAVRGTTATVTLTGRHLDTVTRVTGPGVTAELVGPAGFDRLTVKLSLPPRPWAGPIKLTAASPLGDSNAADLIVDLFPLKTTAGVLPLDSTVVGGIERAGDVARHRFHARAGDEIGVATVTASIGSKLTAVVELIDPNGRVIGEGPDSIGAVAPIDGVYTVTVRDREYQGGPALNYRLHVGRVPVVTGFSPLGLPRGQTATVTLHGVNLPSRVATVTADAEAMIGAKLPVPVASPHGPVYGLPTLVVGEWPEAEAGGTVAVPGTANGVLTSGSPSDTRFRAKKGERLVVEVAARRLGAATDPVVEIRDANGVAVPRLLLRCVAKTNVSLRDHDSSSPGIRLEAWNEFATDDYLLIDQEVIRINALPLGPDEDTKFTAVNFARKAFFDTTPTAHALGAAVYKVEPHPPGTELPSNGLPVVTLIYRNDDGGFGYGKDSRLMFTAPADGEYVARVADALGRSGPEFAYRLTVRPPAPDFRLSVSPANPRVWRGGAVPLTVTAERIDDFDGPIDVALTDLPPGYTASASRIDPGEVSTAVALSASADAKPGDRLVRVEGRAAIGSTTVMRTATAGKATIVEPGDIVTRVTQSEIVIRPGRETHFDVAIDRRNGFKGRVPVEVRGLPHGVRVMNVGLNGILITERETARRVTLYAEPWVTPTRRDAVVLSRREDKKTEFAAPPVPLRVEPELRQ